MTKDQWLKRCETVWAKGLVTPDRLSLLGRWLEIVARFEHGDTLRVVELLAEERRRKRPDGVKAFGQMEQDPDGYALLDLAAVLGHPCQDCAEDPGAWHTRPGFCQHRKAG